MLGCTGSDQSWFLHFNLIPSTVVVQSNCAVCSNTCIAHDQELITDPLLHMTQFEQVLSSADY